MFAATIILAGVGWRVRRAARTRFAAAPAVDAALARAVTGTILWVTVAIIAAICLLLAGNSAASMSLAVVLLAIAVLAHAALGNAISGATLALCVPIAPGDILQLDGRTLRLCRLGITHATCEAADGKTVLVANGQIAGGAWLERPATDAHRWIEVTLRLALRTNPDQILMMLSEAATRMPAALAVPPPIVRLAGIDAAAFEFLVRVAVAPVTIQAAGESDLRMTLVRAARAHGLDLPHAQTDVHLRDLDVLKTAFAQYMEERRRTQADNKD